MAGAELAALTPRECEVLALVRRPHNTDRHRADAWEGTIKTHIGHIFAKLNLRDRAAAVIVAFNHGLVQPVPARRRETRGRRRPPRTP